MTVSTQTIEATSVCNGVTTTFSVPFQVSTNADLQVSLVDPITYANEQVLSEGVDYVVSGNLQAGVASIITLIAYPAGRNLWRRRKTARTQEQVYTPNDGFPAKSHEFVADKAIMIAQEQDRLHVDLASRALQVPTGEVAPIIPNSAARTGKFLAFDASGNPVASLGTGADAGLRNDLAGSGGGGLVAVALPFPNIVKQSLVSVLASGPVDFTFFYRAEDGVDWTPAYQRALNTGRNVFVPEGRFLRLKSATTQGQQIIGCGVTRSVFVIGSAATPFQDMAAQGVDITPSTFDDTAYGHDGIGFEFYQPNTNVRANVLRYPYAIYMAGVDRPKFGDVRISNGWNGIYADGCGGLEAGVIELGCFNTPFLMDHAYDTTTIRTLKFWPYGSGNVGSTTPLLWQVYQDGVAYSQIGRIDGTSIGLLATFQQRIKFYQSDAGGHEFGTIGELHLDGTFGRIEQDSAYLSVGSWYASTGSNTDFKILLTGGRLALGPCAMFLGPGGNGTAPLIQISGGYLSAQSGGFFEALGVAQPLLAQSGGDVVWIGGQILGLTNQTRTRAVFEQTGGRITLRSARFSDAGTGTGFAFSIATDDNHDIQENALLGWGFALPPTIAQGQYDIDRTIPAVATVAFTNNGDFAPVYTAQSTGFRISGNTISFTTTVVFNTNAFTTASGPFLIKPNIPYLPKATTAVTIQQMSNVTFGSPFSGEIQGDGTIPIRLFTSNAPVGNMGNTNILPSKNGVMFVISGTYIV
ncbi:hypothetical protein [Sphingomonas oligoaromativorans]|uniref:hypothetical protein n=1 Tax=Sphingomonas oligoaromativorans TaxID=575322 RepID=UPI0014216439|nr:hypothetical protein [Sphingomonas oligoaromativorans]NIJ34344.1 hypothetical protein [Sphingomonas oligoaromativorans]